MGFNLGKEEKQIQNKKGGEQITIRMLYLLVLCVNLKQARIIREEDDTVEEMLP